MTAATNQRVRTFPLPDVGEGLTEAEILEWKIAPGDDVVVNQIIVEIETAKAAVELPCPWKGKVVALLAEPGVTIAVGSPIISIDTDPGAGDLPGDGPAPVAPAPAVSAPAPAAAEEAGSKIGEVSADGRIATLVGYIPAAGSGARRPRKGAAPAGPAPTAGAHLAAGGEAGIAVSAVRTAAVEAETTAVPAAATPVANNGARSAAALATPPVRKLAKQLGVDLSTLTPARADGVISRAEVEAAAAGSREAEAPAAPPIPAVGDTARETRIPVKGVRKMTAQAMVASAFSAPHVTEFLTVDVTPMMQLRDRLRARRDFAGVKLTPLTFAAKAVCLASQRTPEINSVWDEAAQEIVVKHYVNLGIAAATPRGLVVPNIKGADRLSLVELAGALTELTDVARQGKTSPASMAGGTVTITNVGVFGVDTGTPIINPGESAILALGSIKDMPWVVDGEIVVRKVCQLALSFDHRVIDGQQGSEFLAAVGALLADPGVALTY